MIVPVILSGGSGTRLWPLSRELYPKQLLNLRDDYTMLQHTMRRLIDLKDIGAPIVICNENHRFMVAEQLRNININPASIILEPVGRNTAPAVAVAAYKALNLEEDPVLLILPADHYIKNVSGFHEALRTGEHYALRNYLIAFGIVPDAPETGYGYIQKGEKLTGSAGNTTDGSPEAVTIGKFFEKPDLKTAKEYIDSGNYCWNSGMFMFKASGILKELKKYAPDIVDICEKSFQQGREDMDFFRLNAEAFQLCPGDSIDYAVMEKTDIGAMIPLQAGWNDIGSWEALWQIGEKDNCENVINGDVLIHDVNNCFLHASSRMVAAVGIQNHVVVETPDAVFISPRNRVQDIKHLVEKLKFNNRKEAISHRKVYRPWGSYETIEISNRFQVKRITVKPGEKLSLQKHFHRAEHWIVVSGTALVTKDGEQFVLKEDQSTYIPLGTIHRIENPGKIPLDIIEVQSGSYLGEDDIVRFEDDYGR